MKNTDVFIIRTKESDQGTEGFLMVQEKDMYLNSPSFICKTFELPWRNNEQQISRIPAGEYEVIIRESPKFGTVYWVKNVPNRSYILIHSGNFAGDREKGYKTHVYGCILLGQKFGWLGEQRAVLNSRITVRRFMNHIGNGKFRMKIIGGKTKEDLYGG